MEHIPDGPVALIMGALDPRSRVALHQVDSGIRLKTARAARTFVHIPEHCKTKADVDRWPAGSPGWTHLKVNTSKNVQVALLLAKMATCALNPNKSSRSRQLLSTLKCVDMRYCNDDSAEILQEMMHSQLMSPEEIRLDSKQLAATLPRMPAKSMRRLWVRGMGMVFDDAALFQMSVALPALSELTLTLFGCAKKKVYSGPLANMKNLRSLNVTFNGNGVRCDLGAIAAGCSRLESLCISCVDIDIDGLLEGDEDAPVEAWPSLTSVLFRNAHVHPKLLSAVKPHLAPSLVSLLTASDYDSLEWQNHDIAIWSLKLSATQVDGVAVDHVFNSAKSMAACHAVKNNRVTIDIEADTWMLSSLAPLASVQNISVTVNQKVDDVVMNALVRALPQLTKLRLGLNTLRQDDDLKGAVQAVARAFHSLPRLRELWLVLGEWDDDDTRRDNVLANMCLLHLLEVAHSDLSRTEPLVMVIVACHNPLLCAFWDERIRATNGLVTIRMSEDW